MRHESIAAHFDRKNGNTNDSLVMLCLVQLSSLSGYCMFYTGVVLNGGRPVAMTDNVFKPLQILTLFQVVS